jgi:hypothetical protein
MPTPEERGTGQLEVQGAKKARKQYMGRRALLELILSKSPGTQRWLMAKMEKQIVVKAKAMRDIQLLAKSIGVKLVKLEIK